MILYLSVARDLVSLWDTPEQRHAGALKGEVMVNLDLDKDQTYIMDVAKRAATVVTATGARVPVEDSNG